MSVIGVVGPVVFVVLVSNCIPPFSTVSFPALLRLTFSSPITWRALMVSACWESPQTAELNRTAVRIVGFNLWPRFQKVGLDYDWLDSGCQLFRPAQSPGCGQSTIRLAL